MHADYWGAAGIIHLLLFGKWMEDVEVAASEGSGLDDESCPLDARPAAASSRRYKLRDTFKRYWQTELWTATFDALMNPPVTSRSDDAHTWRHEQASLNAAVADLQAYLTHHAERRGLRASLRRIEERIRAEQRRRRA